MDKYYKGFLLATASGVMFAPAAQAADLPLKAATVAPIQVPLWTGWYGGFHLGGARVSGQNQVGGAGYTPDSTAFIYGGQLGYNWQSGSFVFGLEADITGFSGGQTFNDDVTGYITHGNSLNWLATFRGRMGLAVGSTMVYMTGGLAVAEVDNTHFWGAGEINYSSTKTRWGWTVGAGIEHMLTRNWTVGFEFLYVDLGRYQQRKDAFTNTIFSNEAMIGRFKMNYKF